MSTRRDKRVNPVGAIVVVFCGVLKGKRFRDNFVNTIARLMRLFYFTCMSCKEEGRCDLIVEFPKTKPDLVLGMLKNMELSHEPCSYPEYMSTWQETTLQLEVTNRFKALGELDDDKSF